MNPEVSGYFGEGFARGVALGELGDDLSGRVKSGHTWTGQNRPTGDRVETVRFYPAAS